MLFIASNAHFLYWVFEDFEHRLDQLWGIVAAI